MFWLGLNRLQHAGRHDDWLWIVDRSNQIGKQKCLLVLGVQQSKLPPAGTPLRLKDKKVLGLFPPEKCKRESVGKVYRQIADKYGIPRAVISDGAVELGEPVNRLRAKGKAAKPLVRKIIKFLRIYEKKLYLNERLPMSSEIIESRGSALSTRSKTWKSNEAAKTHDESRRLHQSTRIRTLTP